MPGAGASAGGTHEAGFGQRSAKISGWRGYSQSGVVDGKKANKNGGGSGYEEATVSSKEGITFVSQRNNPLVPPRFSIPDALLT